MLCLKKQIEVRGVYQNLQGIIKPMKLVIVESPAKAKTINKYLGSDYNVIASYGHIRDLPSKNGSVIPEEDFAMKYEISDKSTKHVKAICDAAKKADALLL